MSKTKRNNHFKTIKLGQYSIREILGADWKVYRRIYLQALKEAPTIFPDEYSVIKKRSDQDWQDFLEKIYNDPRSILAGIFFEGSDLVGIIKVIGEVNSGLAHASNIQGVYLQKSHANAEVEKRSVQAVMDYLKKCDVNKLRAAIVTTNRHEMALFNELGFIRYGYEQEHVKIGRKFYDSILIAKAL